MSPVIDDQVERRVRMRLLPVLPVRERDQEDAELGGGADAFPDRPDHARQLRADRGQLGELIEHDEDRLALGRSSERVQQVGPIVEWVGREITVLDTPSWGPPRLDAARA